MTNEREPQQVAKRALVLGALAFRASLELSDYPQVTELSQKLLSWLYKIGCQDKLDPIEHELLATPFGQLSDSQRIDANWAGEAATFFCCMLNLAPPLDEKTAADQSVLPKVLMVFQPDAVQIVQNASLREHTDIEDMCRHFVLIRSMLQEARVDSDAAAIIRRVTVLRLSDVGVTVTEDVVRRASEVVAVMTAQEKKQAAGCYFIRDHAALWFLSGRDRYFESHS